MSKRARREDVPTNPYTGDYREGEDDSMSDGDRFESLELVCPHCGQIIRLGDYDYEEFDDEERGGGRGRFFPGESEERRGLSSKHGGVNNDHDYKMGGTYE